MRYTFCTIDHVAATAWLRAGLIVAYQHAIGNSKKFRWVFGKNNIEDSLSNATKDDCFIFIKRFNNEIYSDTLLRARDKCGKIILDTSDDFSEENLGIWTQINDAVICDTNSAVSVLDNQGFKNIIKIDHIHSNCTKEFSQKRKRINALNVAGYVGLPQQLSNSEKISSFFTKRGLAWYQASPNISNNEYHSAILDLGIIYHDEKMKLRLKPHNKLMNLYSYGIPVFFSPYESYLEVTKEVPELQQMCVSSCEEIFSKFEELFYNQNFQKNSNAAFELSKNYHVTQYERCYRSLINFIENS